MFQKCKVVGFETDVRNSAGRFEKLEVEYQDICREIAITGTSRQSKLRCQEPSATIAIPVYFYKF